MIQYLDLAKRVLETGSKRSDRTGTGTLSVFGVHLEIDLKEGFPLLTTKSVHFHSIVHELLWFISGDTNIEYLRQNSVSIWDPWADESGNLGPIYGAQWRSWGAGGFSVDQLYGVIQALKTDPYSRRHIVSAWNVGQLHQMALPPCHILFQFYVSNKGGLSLQLYQRSADIFLGLPFNIASYALLIHMVASITGLNPERLLITIGDAHIYLNHVDQMKIQIGRSPRKLPEIWINPEIKEIDEFRAKDIRLDGYNPWPALRGEVSV